MVKRTVSLASAPSRSSIRVFVTFVAMRSPLSSRRVCPTPTNLSAGQCLQATQAGSVEVAGLGFDDVREGQQVLAEVGERDARSISAARRRRTRPLDKDADYG